MLSKETIGMLPLLVVCAVICALLYLFREVHWLYFVRPCLLPYTGISPTHPPLPSIFKVILLPPVSCHPFLSPIQNVFSEASLFYEHMQSGINASCVLARLVYPSSSSNLQHIGFVCTRLIHDLLCPYASKTQCRKYPYP